MRGCTVGLSSTIVNAVQYPYRVAPVARAAPAVRLAARARLRPAVGATVGPAVRARLRVAGRAAAVAAAVRVPAARPAVRSLRVVAGRATVVSPRRLVQRRVMTLVRRAAGRALGGGVEQEVVVGGGRDVEARQTRLDGGHDGGGVRQRRGARQVERLRRQQRLQLRRRLVDRGRARDRQRGWRRLRHRRRRGDLRCGGSGRGGRGDGDGLHWESWERGCDGHRLGLRCRWLRGGFCRRGVALGGGVLVDFDLGAAHDHVLRDAR